MRRFHKPVHRPADVIETLRGDGDPADLRSAAHETAGAFLHRIRQAPDPEIVDRLITYADLHGIDDIAELWADAEAVTLPGAMWRLHLLRHLVASDPERTAYRFRRGLDVDGGVSQAIAGSPNAPSPDEVLALATQILRGAFTGDFAVALERAAAFCRVLSAGATELADSDHDLDRAIAERERGAAFLATAQELRHAARAWDEGRLS